jgi:carbonic anhydrase/acetyltransferase-like protein (isoleucine patch superfamily)
MDHAAPFLRSLLLLCKVRINGVVHLQSRVAPGETVPIGWVAVGAPAQILPPDQHDKIWEIQEPLNFPLAVYGFDRSEADMVKITRRLSEALAAHSDDVVNA